MMQNYLKTAWRNVSHDKRTLLLNITGLSVGIAAVFLLFTVVRFETSYDTFHANARQIYRVVTLEKFDSGIDYNAGVPNPLPEALKTDLPNLRKVVPLKKFDDCQLTIAEAGSGQPRKFREEAVYFTEPGYFDLFDSKWLSGGPEALNDPGVIVLDRSMADKFFGNWNEATGQTILVENVLPVKVGGVIESIPSNTNLPLDLIISFATVKANADLLNYDPAHWGATSSNFQTYILLDKQTSRAAIDKQRPEEALGKTIRIGGHDRWMEITGVVKDFATHSLREEIKPVLIASNHAWYQVAGIKLRSDGTRQALATIQELWESLFPDHVYNGNFLDDTIAGFYRHESQLVRVYRVFALLAVFISCMGLFGIVSFITVQKTREIGIRKVLGASVSGIVAMLSKDFATLVLIAVAIASPIAWWAMNQWLLDFAYRIRIEWWMFAATGLAAIAIALLTVSYESVRAALANPVESLRNE
ncbi:MAG: hypothetical protein ABS46_13825 [Cytophagaceae bacterium SCN 52-12]|nr:MAG: hypothetical protein ABS46_13825 [Cytophagaceae bacterium SCN 52-12]